MNVARNAVAMVVLFVFVFAFAFLWYFIPQLMDGIYSATNTAAPSENLDTSYLNYLTFKAVIIQGFYVLVSILVFFTFLSSIFNTQSLQGYLFSVFAGLIITPIGIYAVSTFWNTFSLMGITFSEISMTFINSFATIMLINFIAGLLAFLFIRRSAQPIMG